MPGITTGGVALHWAVKRGSPEAMRALLRHGARYQRSPSLGQNRLDMDGGEAISKKAISILLQWKHVEARNTFFLGIQKKLSYLFFWVIHTETVFSSSSHRDGSGFKAYILIGSSLFEPCWGIPFWRSVLTSRRPASLRSSRNLASSLLFTPVSERSHKEAEVTKAAG